MEEYGLFVKYYDEIVRPEKDQLEDEFFYLNELVENYNPNASSILECACGTGLILNKFKESWKEVFWIDLSPRMIERTKKLIWDEFVMEADMTNFDLGRKFDVVLCNYNSICHLTTEEKWVDFFKTAKKHLNDKWILIFDITTIFEFESLVEDFTLSKDFGDDTLCLKVLKEWDLYCREIKMFKKLSDGRYDLVREIIKEKSFEVSEVKSMLNKQGFFIDSIEDYHNIEVSSTSERVYFVASLKK